MLNVFPIRLTAFLLLLLCGPCPSVLAQEDLEAEAALSARVQKYLPRCFPKLQRRARVRVAIMGDSVSLYYLPTEADRYNREKVWHYHFLKQLTDRFYYSGGVVEAPTSRTPDHTLPPPVEVPEGEDPPLPPRGEVLPLSAKIPGGPEILFENFAKGGAPSIQSLQVLSTYGLDQNPDLVLWMFGVNDANTGVPLAAYRNALSLVIKTCKEKQIDLVIAGPSLICGESLQRLSATLPYSKIAQHLAKEANVLYVDMARALTTLPFTPPFDATESFASYHKALRELYTHHGEVDELHPNAKGQQIMGQAAWGALNEDPEPDILKPSGYFAHPEQEGSGPNLFIALHQPPVPEGQVAEPLAGIGITVLGQPGGWKRAGEDSYLVKEFVDHRNMRIPLVPSMEGVPGVIPASETTTASAIVYEGTTARLINLTIPVTPISVDIPIERLEGIAGDLLLDCKVTNTGAEFKGTAVVEWLDKKLELAVAMEAKSTKPLKIRLPLPQGNAAQGPLKVTLKAGDHTIVSERMIDATRNFLPDQKLVMKTRDAATSPPTLSVNADRVGLYTTFELPPIKAAPAAGTPIATLVLMIDARGPTERGKPGYVDRWQINVPEKDGPVGFDRLRPACFGTGYDRDAPSSAIRASVKTEASGKRKVQIDVPRNYFYLHQWSLAESGQNTLGFNAKVYLPADDPATVAEWAIVKTAFHDNDATALGVLQLTPKSTGEWSVRIY